ncbi:hypothetical protein SY89_00248 [Halolamina pelagica]|jgi:hypothetical protein|uniref:Uncharacterized protein n=1 Tax=Halolamina pelagica TaxID=699431 RepID=A0A0P7GLM9_9EURY|nr:hypothetical protein [Halolamina pelagica]KPN29534.1 hypothetical protein SY89_00248 [Halolamina pelagica]
MVAPANIVGEALDFLVSNPLFTVVLVGMLGFVFFMYLLVRRTLLGLREGYDSGKGR